MCLLGVWEHHSPIVLKLQEIGPKVGHAVRKMAMVYSVIFFYK